MINKKHFQNEINEMINEGIVENYHLKCVDNMLLLLNDEKLVNKFYEDFKNNYDTVFGQDDSNILMKIQDFVFRLDLFCLITTNEFNKFYNLELVKKAIMENDLDLYSGVSYSAEETREILEDYFYSLSEIEEAPF